MLLQVILIVVGDMLSLRTYGGYMNLGVVSLIKEYSSEQTPKPTLFLGHTL
jgi:hypothetical protein